MFRTALRQSGRVAASTSSRIANVSLSSPSTPYQFYMTTRSILAWQAVMILEPICCLYAAVVDASHSRKSLFGGPSADLLFLFHRLEQLPLHSMRSETTPRMRKHLQLRSPPSSSSEFAVYKRKLASRKPAEFSLLGTNINIFNLRDNGKVY
jgi:hypothetical protein